MIWNRRCRSNKSRTFWRVYYPSRPRRRPGAGSRRKSRSVESRRHVLRFSLVFLILIACLGVFVVKLVLIQTFRSGYLTNLAAKQQRHLVELEPLRGKIGRAHV